MRTPIVSSPLLAVLHAGRQAAHYGAGDLSLFPSLAETFGNVPLEALASGVPVVTPGAWNAA